MSTLMRDLTEWASERFMYDSLDESGKATAYQYWLADESEQLNLEFSWMMDYVLEDALVELGIKPVVKVALIDPWHVELTGLPLSPEVLTWVWSTLEDARLDQCSVERFEDESAPNGAHEWVYLRDGSPVERVSS